MQQRHDLQRPRDRLLRISQETAHNWPPDYSKGTCACIRMIAHRTYFGALLYAYMYVHVHVVRITINFGLYIPDVQVDGKGSTYM